MRALSVPLKLMDQARALKHDKDLSNRLTDRAAGLLGHGAVLTIIGLQNAGKIPNCGTPAWEQLIARPVDPVNLAGEMRVIAWPAAGYGVVAAAGPGGDEDEQA